MSSCSPEPQKGPGSRRTYSKPFVIVIAVVFVLVVSVILLSVAGYTSTHEPGRPEQLEIIAMEAALESYNADHGNYPSDPNSTEQLKPNSSFDPHAYIASSEFLYSVLSGTRNGTESSKNSSDNTTYFPFSPGMLKTGANGKTYVVDPWGNSFGYSTFKAVHPDSKEGNNPSYDLWSTHGGKSADQSGWTTNW